MILQLAAAQGQENFLAIIIGTSITTIGIVAVALIQVKGNRKQDAIKTDTETINNAVNHVSPGEPPLTKRFNDFRAVMNDSIEEVKIKAIETKDQVNERFDTVEQKIDGFTEVVNGLMKMHVKTSEDITSIREAVDNRKNSFKKEA